MITAEWSGLDEALRNVQALGEELSREEVLEPALLRAAGPLRDDLERTAPRGKVAPHVADTFVVERSRTEREAGRTTVLVGPKAGYPGLVAPFLEFGTSRMAARPWIRAAYDAFAPGFPAALTRTLGQAYRRVVGKYARRAGR